MTKNSQKILGAVLVVFGLFGIAYWWGPFLAKFLLGFLSLLALLAGVSLLYAGRIR